MRGCDARDAVTLAAMIVLCGILSLAACGAVVALVTALVSILVVA